MRAKSNHSSTSTSLAATAAFRPPTPSPPTTDRLDASRPAHNLAPGCHPADLRSFTEFVAT